MEHREELSVLMCARDSEAYIRDSIASILGQTYGDFRFVIVENGSTDRTWEIINSFRDTRIRPFQTEVKQLNYNLNFGMTMTGAKWIARMDSDDVSEPDRLSRQMEHVRGNPGVHVLGTGFTTFGADVKPRKVLPPCGNAAVRRNLPFRLAICHPSVMFLRSRVLAVGGYGGGFHSQDIDLWLRLSRDRTTVFDNVRESLLRYRIHAKQQKGSRESYAELAGLLLRESIVGKSPLALMGSAMACAKSFLRGR
jgi:glycosyltransferase involved in cell wall biosynthesis